MIKSKLCTRRDEIDETKHSSFSLLITTKFEATSISTETELLEDYLSLTMLILPSNENFGLARNRRCRREYHSVNILGLLPSAVDLPGISTP